MNLSVLHAVTNSVMGENFSFYYWTKLKIWIFTAILFKKILFFVFFFVMSPSKKESKTFFFCYITDFSFIFRSEIYSTRTFSLSTSRHRLPGIVRARWGTCSGRGRPQPSSQRRCPPPPVQQKVCIPVINVYHMTIVGYGRAKESWHTAIDYVLQGVLNATLIYIIVTI